MINACRGPSAQMNICSSGRNKSEYQGWKTRLKTTHAVHQHASSKEVIFRKIGCVSQHYHAQIIHMGRDLRKTARGGGGYAAQT